MTSWSWHARRGRTVYRPICLKGCCSVCGRPLLIASPQRSDPLLGTVMVCWNETAEAARAVAAATPLLVKAERVVLAGVEEHDPSLADGLTDLSRQLAWHGITAEVEFMSSA